jgi:hypothetical protein
MKRARAKNDPVAVAVAVVVVIGAVAVAVVAVATAIDPPDGCNLPVSAKGPLKLNFSGNFLPTGVLLPA